MILWRGYGWSLHRTNDRLENNQQYDKLVLLSDISNEGYTYYVGSSFWASIPTATTGTVTFGTATTHGGIYISPNDVAGLNHLRTSHSLMWFKHGSEFRNEAPPPWLVEAMETHLNGFRVEMKLKGLIDD